jgi:hypothetical protein
MRLSVVIFRHRRNVRGQSDPRLLGGSKNVYIRWQVIRRIERAYPNEPDDGPCTPVVAPYGHAALGAARDLLAFSAVGRRVDDFRLGTQMNHVICLDHGIEREGCTALPLAPSTMAAMYKQRSLQHAIADDAAIAASLEGKNITRDHARSHLASHPDPCGPPNNLDAVIRSADRPVRS